MCPVVRATSAYNHTLAKWFNNKLKLLSLNDENQYTVTSGYDFVNPLVFKKYTTVRESSFECTLTTINLQQVEEEEEESQTEE